VSINYEELYAIINTDDNPAYAVSYVIQKKYYGIIETKRNI